MESILSNFVLGEGAAEWITDLKMLDIVVLKSGTPALFGQDCFIDDPEASDAVENRA